MFQETERKKAMDTRDVANFVLTTSFEKLPPDVIVQTKSIILDTLGVSLAGRDTRAAECSRRMVRAMGGKEEATLLGVGVKLPAMLATLSNSVQASACDMDDGMYGPWGHIGHFGSVIVPSSLCIAEAQRSTGKELIEAVVVGYETAIVAGLSLLRMAGVLTTGSTGSYGAAAAVAKLLRLNRDEVVNSLMLVDAHNLAGVRDNDWRVFIEKGGWGFNKFAMVKEGIGWGAMTGVGAALLAQQGFTGYMSIYDHPDIEQGLLSSLGKEYGLLKNHYFKSYSACAWTHPALDGVLALVQKHHLSAETISRVIVRSNPTSILLDVRRPTCIDQAQYSIPFLVGAAIVDGKVTPEQINEARLGDKAILSQADKVELEADPALQSAYPGKPGALDTIVKIETRDGRVYETRAAMSKDMASPLTYNDLKEKFRSLSTKMLGKDGSEAVIQCIDGLEKVSSVRELVDLIATDVA